MPPALPRAADGHLRLDGDAAELASGGCRLLGGPRQPAGGTVMPAAAKRCFAWYSSSFIGGPVYGKGVTIHSTRSDPVELLEVGGARAPPAGMSIRPHLLR